MPATTSNPRRPPRHRQADENMKTRSTGEQLNHQYSTAGVAIITAANHCHSQSQLRQDPSPAGNYPAWDEGLAGTDTTAGGEGIDYKDQDEMGATLDAWGAGVLGGAEQRTAGGVPLQHVVEPNTRGAQEQPHHPPQEVQQLDKECSHLAVCAPRGLRS